MMKIPFEDLARQLEVSAITLERWIRQGRIPVQRQGEMCFFERSEIEEWARTHSLRLDLEAPPEPIRPPQADNTLIDSIRRGGVRQILVGNDVATTLRAVVRALPISDDERPDLLRRFLEREELSSTGIGNALAVPHPRNPVGDLVKKPMIAVFFLDHPIDWKAVDGRPVSTLFVVLSPSVREHLQTLVRLSYCLRDPYLCSQLAEAPEMDGVIEAFRRIEFSAGEGLND
jgi:PTS system nitrogen regulatory IIA component